MRLRAGAVILVGLLLGAGAMAEVPTPVSPGGQTGVALIDDRCPTFHWTAASGPDSIDLVVYRLPEDEAQGQPERVLSISLPPATQGWTAALGQCMERGARYAWSIGVGGQWSRASLFEVSTEAAPIEIERAIALLNRLAGGEGPGLRGATSSGLTSRERAPLAPVLRGGTMTAGADPATRKVDRSAPVPDPSPSLSVEGQIHLEDASSFFQDGLVLLWNGASGNLALGPGALKSNTVGGFNTAIGYQAMWFNLNGGGNTAIGSHALQFGTEGSANVAVGSRALFLNQGSDNTAVGNSSLTLNYYGTSNTAVGYRALYSNFDAVGSTAVGWRALASADADANTAVGHEALRLATGHRNTAVGEDALHHLVTGNRNVAVGENAGTHLTAGSNNIFILNEGASDDANTIKIGTQGTQSKTFIAGIRGVTTDVDDGVAVLIDSDGQLGTVSSSRRFKHSIRDMGNASAGLRSLRPVTFQLRNAIANGNRTMQFGLIAEEVAEVIPELVVYDREGRPETVKYHLLSSLLLNELQKQHRRVEVLSWLVGVVLIGGLALTVGRWRFG